MKIDVTKPLKNAASLVVKKKREIFRVKYERLPELCVVCGHLGHMYKECGDGFTLLHVNMAFLVRVGWLLTPLLIHIRNKAV